MLRATIPALLLLAACARISESEFIAEYEAAYCESYAICASEEMKRTVNERECLEFLRYQAYPTRNNECKFSDDAAESCLTDLERAGCSGASPDVPLICDDVFSKCALPAVPAPGDPPIRPE